MLYMLVVHGCCTARKLCSDLSHLYVGGTCQRLYRGMLGELPFARLMGTVHTLQTRMNHFFGLLAIVLPDHQGLRVTSG